MIKRGISVCLVVSMLSTASLTAFAQDAPMSTVENSGVQNINIVSEKAVDDATVSGALKNELKKDREQFSELGLIGIADEMRAEVKDDEITYVLKSGEYENIIKVQNNDDESFKMSVRQDDILNEVAVDEDGTMTVDGNVIEVEQEEETLPNNNIARAPAVFNRITDVCPYGKAADYTYKLGSSNKASLSIQKEVAKTAFGTFVSIICKQLNVPKAVGKAFKKIYNYAVDKDPHSKYLSSKCTNYAHKNYHNTYIKPVKLYGFKSNYTWYTQKNYKGKTVKKTLYQTKEIN